MCSYLYGNKARNEIVSKIWCPLCPAPFAPNWSISILDNSTQQRNFLPDSILFHKISLLLFFHVAYFNQNTWLDFMFDGLSQKRVQEYTNFCHPRVLNVRFSKIFAKTHLFFFRLYKWKPIWYFYGCKAKEERAQLTMSKTISINIVALDRRVEITTQKLPCL